jgi:succinoglycan biosynthesis protein ExoM
VRARADWANVPHAAYLEGFFSRVGPVTSGAIDHYYGCGDSLVRRAALPDPKRPFSAIRNQIGGEDDLLFGAMEGLGAKFAWAADAWVWEDPVPERLTLRYAFLRAFAFGQGATAHCGAAGDRLGVARWMAMGVAQATIFGILGSIQWLVRSNGFVFAFDRAARGLGKTLWWKPFKIRFYGQRSSPHTNLAGSGGRATLSSSAS